MPDNARIIIEVLAGVVPNQPLPGYTKRFYITHDQLKDKTIDHVTNTYNEAATFMRAMWNPNYLNWVQCNWIYL